MELFAGDVCSKNDGARCYETTSTTQEYDGVDSDWSKCRSLLHIDLKYHSGIHSQHSLMTIWLKDSSDDFIDKNSVGAIKGTLYLCDVWVKRLRIFGNDDKPTRHECRACFLLRAVKLGIRPVLGNMHDTRIERAPSSSQEIIRRNHTFCLEARNLLRERLLFERLFFFFTGWSRRYASTQVSSENSGTETSPVYSLGSC